MNKILSGHQLHPSVVKRNQQSLMMGMEMAPETLVSSGHLMWLMA
jgi:hypothetical protein